MDNQQKFNTIREMKKRTIGILIFILLAMILLCVVIWTVGILKAIVIVIITSFFTKLILYAAELLVSDEINNKKP